MHVELVELEVKLVGAIPAGWRMLLRRRQVSFYVGVRESSTRMEQ